MLKTPKRAKHVYTARKISTIDVTSIKKCRTWPDSASETRRLVWVYTCCICPKVPFRMTLAIYIYNNSRVWIFFIWNQPNKTRLILVTRWLRVKCAPGYVLRFIFQDTSVERIALLVIVVLYGIFSPLKALFRCTIYSCQVHIELLCYLASCNWFYYFFTEL